MPYYIVRAKLSYKVFAAIALVTSLEPKKLVSLGRVEIEKV
jgi:hypothetical protein